MPPSHSRSCSLKLCQARDEDGASGVTTSLLLPAPPHTWAPVAAACCQQHPCWDAAPGPAVVSPPAGHRVCGTRRRGECWDFSGPRSPSPTHGPSPGQGTCAWVCGALSPLCAAPRGLLRKPGCEGPQTNVPRQPPPHTDVPGPKTVSAAFVPAPAAVCPGNPHRRVHRGPTMRSHAKHPLLLDPKSSC